MNAQVRQMPYYSPINTKIPPNRTAKIEAGRLGHKVPELETLAPVSVEGLELPQSSKFRKYVWVVLGVAQLESSPPKNVEK